MNPETVLDLFFDLMDRKHWSTDAESVEYARAGTLRIASKAELIPRCDFDCSHCHEEEDDA